MKKAISFLIFLALLSMCFIAWGSNLTLTMGVFSSEPGSQKCGAGYDELAGPGGIEILDANGDTICCVQ